MGHTIAWGPGDRDRRWHEHVTMAAAATATMAVIVGSAVIANGGLRTQLPTLPDLPPPQLTGRAQHALDTLPRAYQADDSVIVPAATDPYLDWVGAFPSDRIVGHAVPLGARGLTSYADVPPATDAPAWTHGLRHADRVFADVGPLWLACTRFPGEGDCSASLLMRHDDRYYVYMYGVGTADFLDAEAPMEVVTFGSVEGGELRQLLVGALGGTATKDVSLTLAYGSRVPASTSVDAVIAGETMWWTTVSQPVESVTAYDSDGSVVGHAQLSG